MPMKPGKVGVEEAVETVHRIRITLSSKNVKNLEKGEFSCAEVILRYPSQLLVLYYVLAQFCLGYGEIGNLIRCLGFIEGYSRAEGIDFLQKVVGFLFLFSDCVSDVVFGYSVRRLNQGC